MVHVVKGKCGSLHTLVVRVVISLESKQVVSGFVATFNDLSFDVQRVKTKRVV